MARARSDFPDRVFIATATPFDDEMRGKIKRHREERGGDFKTVEEPLRLADALGRFSGNPRCCAVVDCLTVWLGNLYAETGREEARRRTEEFAERFESFRGLVIAVTNETGMGIVPPGEESRAYSADLAALNRRLVSLCGEAYLLVAGAAVRIK